MTDTTAPFDPKAFVRNLTQRPGVYRMVSGSGEVLYVGKARNLKKRVSSYFNRSQKSARIELMLTQVEDVQITVTHTEAEALILENNLIKELRPRYNVLLRDDKSYPWIYLSSHQEFPRLSFHRGARKGPGRWFGPFPSGGAVRETLNTLQKVFLIRQCRDTFFANRSRPCLQYQIKRCTAPCVGYISREDYEEDVRHAVLFLEGKSSQVVEELGERMEAASERLAFEEAAHYRDRIQALQVVQERQYIIGEKGDLDVVACVSDGVTACVTVFFFRQGRNLGNKVFFPKIPEGSDETEVVAAFLARYYIGRKSPPELVLSHPIQERALLAEALSRESGHKVRVTHSVRKERRRWLDMALTNARHALSARASSQAMALHRLEALQDELALPALPERIECFDISHTRGEATVASCVVFNQEGPLKSDYRRFNIRGITPGDDYAAMRQALSRRYQRLKKGEGILPDILLIDGGKGQVAQAEAVLEELQVDDVYLLGIAKGPERRPGEETLILSDEAGRSVTLGPDSPALQLLQQVRDEAHRFAIAGHRNQRGKARSRSALEDIPGLGPKRRQALLRHFGGVKAIARAGVEDLARTPGISRALAEKVYDHYHGESG
ncbi:excinuclease ABC subunit C [Alkalispirillum mobile]|uniref:UvrABC system protein C n=1 Tax=Alkalispirillum mobile TaxID=85925 RepID=A0A498C5N6_9GAMM|nr:excinuclease ABC subunit UvrC [Alkalispirillum mobile]RLK50329.1 excinuclease ABC subunit C [Alkalispirillum mobile]